MSLLARLYSKEPTDFSPENIFGPKDQYIWEGETITLESQASSYQFPESHHSQMMQIELKINVKTTTCGSIKIFCASKSDQGFDLAQKQ